MKSQEKRCIGCGPEGSQAQALLSPWSRGAPPPSRHEDVFTTPEAAPDTYHWVFVEASSCRRDQLDF